MKKNLLILIIITSLTTLSSQAQELAFKKGTVAVTAGYGVPNLARVGLRLIYGSYDGYNVKGFGPMLLKGEYGVLNKLGVGAIIGYSSTTLTYNYKDSYYDNNGYYVPYTYQENLKWNSLSLGAHANFHFATKEKVDWYVGGGLGYTLHNITYSNNDPYNKNNNSYIAYNPNSIFYAITIGMRYYFSPNVGIYAEAGIEKGALIQGGLAIKF